MTKGGEGGIDCYMRNLGVVSHEYPFYHSIEYTEGKEGDMDEGAGKFPFPRGGVRECGGKTQERWFRYTRKFLGIGGWWVIEWEAPYSSEPTDFEGGFGAVNGVEEPALLFVNREAFMVAATQYSWVFGGVVPGSGMWIDFEKDILFIDSQSFSREPIDPAALSLSEQAAVQAGVSFASIKLQRFRDINVFPVSQLRKVAIHL